MKSRIGCFTPLTRAFTDIDGAQFIWSADGQPNGLATGALATHQFAIGPHTVQRVVSDGYSTATAQVGFEVITPATAVGQLMLLARRNRPVPRPASARCSKVN